MLALIQNACVLERDNVLALFNPYWPDPVFITELEHEQFTKGEWSDSDRDILLAHRLISEDGSNDVVDFREKYQPEQEVMTLYLILTRTCNLRCSYCFEVERHGVKQYEQEMMSLEVAMQSIKIFASEYLKNQHSWNYQVILYGGEPILNWRVLQASVEELERLQRIGSMPPDLRIALNTNGTLIDESKARYLAEHKVLSAVSVDGDQQTHDRNRVDRNQRGSYVKALNGYRILSDAGANVCPSLTISPETAGQVLEIVRDLHGELGFKAIGLNPLMAAPAEFPNGPGAYHGVVANDIVECFRWARDLGIAEDRALRKVNSIMSLKPHIADCCAYGQQIVVQPDGSVGICHATSDHNHCTVWDYVSPNETERVSEWIKRLPINQDSCSGCEAIFICGGGCAHSALLLHDDLASLDSGFCIHSKSMLEFLIWDIFDKMETT